MHAPAPRSPARYHLLLLAAGAVAAISAGSCAPVATTAADATTFSSPTEALELSEGKPLLLPAEKGKVVVLGFYAVWCPVSRKMLRALAGIITPSRLRQGLVVIPVDEEDGRADAERFARAAGLRGPIGLDAEGNFTRAMKLDTVPGLVVVGRDGVVRRTHAGFHGDDDIAMLGREIDALLAARKDGSAPPIAGPDDEAHAGAAAGADGGADGGAPAP